MLQIYHKHEIYHKHKICQKIKICCLILICFNIFIPICLLPFVFAFCWFYNYGLTDNFQVSYLREALERAEAVKIKRDVSHYLAWMDCCGNNEALLVKKLEEGNFVFTF